MIKILMITGLLYLGYRLISKPQNNQIDKSTDDLLDEEFTDYEELD